MSVAQTVPASRQQPQATPGCCDRIKEALGRCWEWIVDCWHWFVDKVFRFVDAIAFGFFRTVECFSPTLAMRMEAGYGYLATWYARHTAAVQEQILQRQVSGLETVNRNLNQRVQTVTTESAHLKAAHTQAKAERDRLKTEREADIRAREKAVAQNNNLQTENRRVSERNAFLQSEAQRLQTEVQEAISSRAPIQIENDRLTDERNNLVRSNELLQMHAENAKKLRDISYVSLQIVGRINTHLNGLNAHPA